MELGGDSVDSPNSAGTGSGQSSDTNYRTNSEHISTSEHHNYERISEYQSPISLAVTQRSVSSSMEPSSQGSSNLANLASIDQTFFHQQQQLHRAEQLQKLQQQQQQQTQPSSYQLTRPIGSPSSNTSTECLASDRASTEASSSTSTSSGSTMPQQQTVRALNLTTTNDDVASGSMQTVVPPHPMMSKSDTIDDIQSLGSQFNLCLNVSQAQLESSSQIPSILLQPAQPFIQGHGHHFTKKTFHKPTYCHHCADMLWGLIGQGYICDLCNFVVHERCIKTVVSCCSTVASSTIKNPMPHCWAETHSKRKFCNVCRKRIDDNVGAIRCSVCEYCIHPDCQEFSISDCRECATYVPDQTLKDVVQKHHWREGNLPQTGSKCYCCKKSCFSAECLTGMRCEWCQMTVHASCLKNTPKECNLGCLQSIMLPPYCVSIPRTDVPMETIIGVSGRFSYSADKTVVSAIPGSKRDNLTPRSTSEDFAGYHQQVIMQQYENDIVSRDKDEELLRLYDGNSALKKRSFRLISVPRSVTRESLISACLRVFYIHDDVNHYKLIDINDGDRELDDPFPILAAASRRNTASASGGDKQNQYVRNPPISILMRYRPPDSSMGYIKVYPGRLNVTEITYCNVPVTSDSSVSDVMRDALDKFKLRTTDLNRYRLVEVSLDKGSSVHERTMDNQECPWEIIKNVARESVRQKENTRFYLQQQDEVYCSSVAIFIGNLHTNLSQKQYEHMLTSVLSKPYRFKEISIIYYEYGSLILTYDNADMAVKAFYRLRDSTLTHNDDSRVPVVLLLPNIVPEMIPEGVRVSFA